MTGGYRLGLVLITCSAIAWSTAGLFTRWIPLDSWTLLAWRGVFGGLGLAVLIAVTARGESWGGLHRLGWPGWAFVLISAMGMVFFITSLRHTTVAHNAVIYATCPFLAAALAFVLSGERPQRSAIVASLAALAGVAIMVGLGTEGGLFGDILAVGMTLCLALMITIARRWRDLPVMQAACLSAFASAAICWPFGDPLAVSGEHLLMLAAFGIVNSMLGLALFTMGARLLPAIETALIGALDAPLAPLWVWLFFSETPSQATLVGGGIVFAAVLAHVGSSASRKSSGSEAGEAF
jgi:drug/metabolite transporter (DMT)-like permease